MSPSWSSSRVLRSEGGSSPESQRTQEKAQKDHTVDRGNSGPAGNSSPRVMPNEQAQGA